MLTKIKRLFAKKTTGNANQSAKKEQIKNALVLLAIAGFSYGFYCYSSMPAKQEVKKEDASFDGVFDNAFTEASDEALIEKQQRQLDELKVLVTKNDNTPQATKAPLDPETQTLLKSMEEKLAHLEEDNKKTNEQLQVALLKTTQFNSAGLNTRPPTHAEMEARRIQRQQAEKELYSHAGLETVRFRNKKTRVEERTAANYVWAGSFVEGVLETGIIGDAGINGSKNMGTALIRLVSDGIMPNEQHSHLKDCFALVSTYGDLSASSVVLHLETLSCAGKQINFEQSVYGSVFDLDAMQDLRGTSILKTKPLLGYSAAAGTLAGFGDGLKNLNASQTINPGAGTITTYGQASTLAQSAAGGALSNPANRIADYVMRIADIYHPLVVARAGRRVSVLFTKGFWIDRAHQTYESGKWIEAHKAQNDSEVNTSISTSAYAGNQPAGTNVLQAPNVAANNPGYPHIEQQYLKQLDSRGSPPLFSRVEGNKSND